MVVIGRMIWLLDDSQRLLADEEPSRGGCETSSGFLVRYEGLKLSILDFKSKPTHITIHASCKFCL